MSESIVITARASSLPTAADCSYRWYAQQIEGLDTPSGPRTILGSAVHHSTALHDQHVLDGDPLRADESAGAAIDYLREHRAEVNWRGQEDEENPLRESEVASIAVSLHARYCTEIAPTRRYSAIEPVLGVLEVEIEGGVIVRLTGQADRTRIELLNGVDAEITSDLKSGGRVVSAAGVVDVKGYVFQVASYKLLRFADTGIAMHRLTEIIGLNTGKTPASQRVGVGFCEDAEETLIGTADKPGFLHALGWMAKTGVFPGNPKSSLCSPKFCPIYHTCHYRK